MADELPPDDEWSFWQVKHAALAESQRLRDEARAGAAPIAVLDAPRRFLALDADCPVCGGDLDLVAAGRSLLGGQELRNVIGCTRCNRHYAHTQELHEVTREVGVRPRHPAGCPCPPCVKERAA